MLKTGVAYPFVGLGIVYALSACASTPSSSQTVQLPSISGVIVDPRGEAVSGAKVTTIPPTDLVKTKSAGKFLLRQMEDGANIPSGTYQLVVAADNYRLVDKIRFSYEEGTTKDLGSIKLELEKGIEWREVTDEDGTVRRVPVGGEGPDEGI